MSVTVTKIHEPKGVFGWLQVEKKIAQQLEVMAIKHPVAMAVLLNLTRTMSPSSNAVIVSGKGLAERLNVSLSAIRKSIVVLSDMKYIQVVKIGSANAYIVNSKVAWQGNRGARFTVFNADVVAFEFEQMTDTVDDKSELVHIPRPQENERVLVGNEPIEPPDQQELELP